MSFLLRIFMLFDIIIGLIKNPKKTINNVVYQWQGYGFKLYHFAFIIFTIPLLIAGAGRLNKFIENNNTIIEIVKNSDTHNTNQNLNTIANIIKQIPEIIIEKYNFKLKNGQKITINENNIILNFDTSSLPNINQKHFLTLTSNDIYIKGHKLPKEVTDSVKNLITRSNGFIVNEILNVMEEISKNFFTLYCELALSGLFLLYISHIQHVFIIAAIILTFGIIREKKLSLKHIIRFSYVTSMVIVAYFNFSLLLLVYNILPAIALVLLTMTTIGAILYTFRNIYYLKSDKN